jgi:hypothetical protein
MDVLNRSASGGSAEVAAGPGSANGTAEDADPAQLPLAPSLELGTGGLTGLGDPAPAEAPSVSDTADARPLGDDA